MGPHRSETKASWVLGVWLVCWCMLATGCATSHYNANDQAGAQGTNTYEANDLDRVCPILFDSQGEAVPTAARISNAPLEPEYQCMLEAGERFRYGLQAFRDGHHERAEEVFEELERNCPVAPYGDFGRQLLEGNGDGQMVSRKHVEPSLLKLGRICSEHPRLIGGLIWYWLGVMRLNLYNQKDLALNHLEAACKIREPLACDAAGFILFKLSKQNERALDRYLEACDLEYAAGCVSAGNLLDTAQGDNLAALDAYRKGCAYGSAQSCRMAGELALRKFSKVDEAGDFFERGCEGGSGRACFELAFQRLERDGTQWMGPLGLLKRGCLMDFGPACLAAAQIVENHDDVLWISRGLHERACELKEGRGCTQASLSYFKDPAKQFGDDHLMLGYALQGCELDDGLGCYLAGTIMEKLLRDNDRAGELYQRACSLGYRQACERVFPSH
jgi:TPR repeat protein